MMITLLTPTTSNANSTSHLTNTVKNYPKSSSQSQIKTDSFQIKQNPREETPAIVASPTVTNQTVALVDSPSLPATTTTTGLQPDTFQTATNSALAPVNAAKLATNTKPTDLGLIATIISGIASLGIIGLGVALWTKHDEFNKLNGDLTTLKQTVAQQRKLITDIESKVKEGGLTQIESLSQKLEQLIIDFENQKSAEAWVKANPKRIDTLPESPKGDASVGGIDWSKGWFEKDLTLAGLKDRLLKDDAFNANNTKPTNINLRQDPRFLAEVVLPAFANIIDNLGGPNKTSGSINKLNDSVEALQLAFEKIDPNTAHNSPVWGAIEKLADLSDNATDADKLAREIINTRLSSNNPDHLKPLVEKVYLLLRDQLEKIPA